MPRNPNPDPVDKTKFSMWVADSTLEDLKRVQRIQGRESLSEVIRDALTVYTDLIKASERGIDLYFQDTKTKESGRIWLLPRRLPVRREVK